ncbi:MFS transporter [Haladaptatus pallidirubidus]|uniref:MFS transporter n=1 Tax=Haladaptatus pallidirubidus TaxID=1008152 RepID=UPI0035E74B53
MSSSRRSVTSHLQTTVRGLRGDGRGWVLTAVALGWAFTLGLRFLVPALLPQIKSAFEVTNATAGLAITALWVGYALMQFPAGVLINRVGERTLLTTSLCLSGISLCLIGLSPVFVVFFAGSTAFGLGSGLYGPSRGTVLSRTYTRNAGAAFGVTLAVGSIGSAVLPNLATSMVDAVGWRPILACLSVPFFVVAVLAWRVIPERERGRPAENLNPLMVELENPLTAEILAPNPQNFLTVARSATSCERFPTARFSSRSSPWRSSCSSFRV